MRPLFLLAAALSAAPIDDLFLAIRTGNLRRAEGLLRQGGLPQSGGNGLTPLMQAVIAGDAAMVRMVLRRSADPNAKGPSGLTALHAAVHDPEKTRLLLEAGADPNAAMNDGRTPLHGAAMREGGAAIARMLIAKGARVNAAPAKPANRVPLRNAADAAIVRVLLEAGAEAPRVDPLGYFGMGACGECVRLSIGHGAAATSSMLARWANIGDAATVRALLDKGAQANANIGRGYTPLMRAAMSYRPDPEVIRTLLARGANPAARNEYGYTALGIARRVGDERIIALLREAGVPEGAAPPALPAPVESNTVKDAIARAIPLLQRAAPPIPEQRGCVSCHNNLQLRQVLALARPRGFAIDAAMATREDERLEKARAKQLPDEWAGINIPEISSYQLFALADAGVKPNAGTDASVHLLAFRKAADGRWKVDDYRPPQEYSPFTYTAISAKALRDYAPPGRAAEMKRRVARAREWLIANRAVDLEEKAFRLLGLRWTGAPEARIGEAATSVREAQQPNGGWRQLATAGEDAYATGLALYALRLGGGVAPSDPAYEKGVRFLLDSQRPDGSWYVASRVFPLQAAMESGFPYGHDQWISAAGTAWAAMALLLGMNEAR
ncbi:MAG: hypothetical protein FJW30_12555 [Acidobacteria bacterium]|nr:hypothetical protein [Acidobacteriota bacterium]